MVTVLTSKTWSYKLANCVKVGNPDDTLGRETMEPLQCNIHEAKTRLSQLIQEALKGRDVVIAKSGRPLVRLQVLPGAGKKRAIGRQKDLVIRMAEDFNAALDDFDPYMP